MIPGLAFILEKIDEVFNRPTNNHITVEHSFSEKNQLMHKIKEMDDESKRISGVKDAISVRLTEYTVKNAELHKKNKELERQIEELTIDYKRFDILDL